MLEKARVALKKESILNTNQNILATLRLLYELKMFLVHLTNWALNSFTNLASNSQGMPGQAIYGIDAVCIVDLKMYCMYCERFLNRD